MSTDKQNNAPLSAEPVIFVTGYRRYDDFELGPICTTLELAEKAVDAWAAQEGYRKECLFIDEQKLLSEPKTAPVAAQPDVTQQTLDDVKAGIPARDAEIEALRKEIEKLQSAQDQPQRLIFPTMLRKMWSGSEVQAWLDDELSKLTKSSSQRAQQPVSGAVERANFETWATHINTERHPHKQEMYFHPGANNGWAAWQARAALAQSLTVDMTPPATARDRWMYDQGRLAERDPRTPGSFAALAQQDATLQAEVLGMVLMLEANEWADHCGKSDLGQRLEWAITALQNRIAELTKSSSQQDAPDSGMERALTELVDKIAPGLDTGDLLADAATASKALDRARPDADKVDTALAEMVHAMFRSANSIPVTRITLDRKQYEAAIDAARKEQT